MTTPNSKNMINILIGVMVLLAAGLTYFYLNKPSSSPDVVVVETGASLVTTTVNINPNVQQIIGLFNEINAIKLEKGVLDQGVYKTLINYRIATTTEATSTPNPFQVSKP